MKKFTSILRGSIALAMLALPCVVARTVAAKDGISRPIAVLPFANRSGRAAPLKEIRAALTNRLSERGIELLDERTLDEFMRRHRMRHTAGISSEMAQRIGAETGSWAVLITTLDLYDERDPSRFGLTSRLVTTEEQPRIAWMGSAILVGDQAPGGFDVGLVTDLEVLQSRALSDLAAAITGERPASSRKTRKRFRPAEHYASPDLPMVRDWNGRIAVLPFDNTSTTRYAGAIVTDQLIRHLVESGANVLEPGVVRQVMLESRQIYSEGPSVPQTDILRLHLEADVIVFGEVSRYEEKLGLQPVHVEFMLRAIDTETGELIWASSSFAGGNKGVFFFGAGQVHAAQKLASEMARALVDTALRERAKATRNR